MYDLDRAITLDYSPYYFPTFTYKMGQTTWKMKSKENRVSQCIAAFKINCPELMDKEERQSLRDKMEKHHARRYANRDSRIRKKRKKM